jgi:5-formyltetrahydrofolate cyclo-ligase
MSISELKILARDQARIVRQEIHGAAGNDVYEALARNVMGALGQGSEKIVVGAYYPMGSEIDCRILMGDLGRRGFETALPVISQLNQPLSFRVWAVGDSLTNGVFGTFEPANEAPLVRPNVLLVPLLAFDMAGYRLGYGGGYYDRTIAEYRAGGDVAAIGLAFSGQLVDAVPHDDTDEKLDFIATEKEVMEIGARKAPER